MARELEEQRDAGIVLASGRTMTVEQWLDHWLTAIAVRRLRPKTYENYSCNVRRHLVRLLGHRRLDRLQPEHVEAAWGHLPAVHAPTARQEEVESLTAAEARRLLQAAKDLPNGARWS